LQKVWQEIMFLKRDLLGVSSRRLAECLFLRIAKEIPMAKEVYEIDGCDFRDLKEFYDEISRVLIPGVEWGRNLDAFNDILRGGFGTPHFGFVLRWKNSAVSRQRLGPEFFRLVEIIQGHCAKGCEQEDGVELVLE
jgi:RNAse (barnase) inhibitor barstar